MSRRPPALPTLALASALAGCGGGSTRALADLEAQVHQLQSEQANQSHRIELLENRVVLAEDSARLARQALVGVGPHRSISLGAGDDAGASDESIPSSVAPGSTADDTAPETPDESRPVVRAQGRERLPPPDPNANPIVVHDDDRIPVAPVPMPATSSPPPARAPRGPGPVEQRTDGAPGEPALPAASPPPASVLEPSHPGVSSARDPRATQAYEQAVAMARGGRCAEALDALSAFLVRWPDHPWADHAMYWRGGCMLSAGDARHAASEFEGLITRFPTGEKVPDALYSLVGVYRRLGEEPRARAAAARLLREYPRSPVADRLRAEQGSDPGARAALETLQR